MRWCCGASSIAPADPPLTAEQLAQKEKEAEVIATQLAEPSYWDEVGPEKPNASALKAALADTVLVDAAWLVRLAKKRGVLPILHFSISPSVTLAPGGRSWQRGSMPPLSASRASHAASTSTVSARAALSAEALGLPGPTLSQ